MSANEKREEVVKKLQSKQDQMLQNNSFRGGNPQPNADQYLSDYKMLEIRMTVMQDEHNEAIYQVEELK